MSSIFDRLDREPVHHFRLLFYRAVLWLRERSAAAGPGGELEFVSGYLRQLEATGIGDSERWGRELAAWEERAPEPLPVAALREAAGLERDDLLVLFLAGLVEEDARFGRVFEAAHATPDHGRPTLGLLNAWAPDGDARPAVRRLLELGLLETLGGDGPATGRPLAVPASVWDALRGEPATRPEPWARLRPRDELPALDDLVLAPDVERQVRAAAGGLGELADALVLRGPATTGRRTVGRALARERGRSALELGPEAIEDPVRWRRAACLATLLRCVPVLSLELEAGGAAKVPEPRGLDAPLVVALGRAGGVQGDGVERAVLIELDFPTAAERERHWLAALDLDPERARELAETQRMTGGNIRRVATLARAQAAIRGGGEPSDAALLAAARALHGQLLDGLAERVEPVRGGWDAVVVEPRTEAELRLLAARCRHREKLRDALGGGRRGLAGAAGVRALLAGPSGTGKTLAARALAAEVGIELYRVDLAAVVDKYIGETEKNFERVFAGAERGNFALLLDEGDAVLAQRTSVQTSNDRYANLETNYLLQRLESFEGVLVVTTNAHERIDQAFRRRMDVVIELRAPDPAERLRVWQLHMPPRHEVGDDELESVAVRCDLTGGQIRNAVLHASLVALERGVEIDGAALRDAVEREYRKAGRALPIDLRELVGA